MFLNQSPVIRLLLPFLSGMVIMISFPFTVIYAVVLFVLLFMLNLFFHTLSTSYNLRWTSGCITYCLFFLIGCIITWLNCGLNNNLHFGNSQTKIFSATIEEPPVIKEKSIKVIVTVNAALEKDSILPTSGKLMVYFSKTEDFDMTYGDQFFFKAKPRRILPPKNPDEFDYARHLAFHNIFYQVYLKKGEYLKSTTRNTFWVYDLSYKLKNYLVGILKNTIHDKEIYSVGSALLVGFSDDLEAPLMNAYAGSGVLHVLSVSGMHVAIIYKVMEWLLSFLLKIRRGKHFYFGIIIIFLWFYALITGLSPSVLRSAMMLSFVIIGKWTGRNTGILNTLAVSCFFLILYNPYLIADAGFQLSFLAVLGIVFLHPFLFRHYQPRNKFLLAVWSITSISLCAQLITFPIGLYYFHQFPNFFLLANLLVIPVTTAAIYACIAVVVLFKIPLIGLLIVKFCYSCIWLSNEIVKLINAIPYSVINGISISAFETIFLYIIILTGLVYLIQKRWLLLAMLVSIIILFQSMQVIENLNQNNQKLIAIYDLKGQSAVGFFNGRECYLLADDSLMHDNKSIQLHLQQHWWKLGVNKPVVLRNRHFAQCLYKRDNVVLFNNKKIMVMDSIHAAKYNYQPVEQLAQFDYLILTRNANISLKKIGKFIAYKNLVIDESSDYARIRKWKLEAKNLKINCYFIDEKGAFISKL